VAKRRRFNYKKRKLGKHNKVTNEKILHAFILHLFFEIFIGYWLDEKGPDEGASSGSSTLPPLSEQFVRSSTQAPSCTDFGLDSNNPGIKK
jgi:hypothetical protein